MCTLQSRPHGAVRQQVSGPVNGDRSKGARVNGTRSKTRFGSREDVISCVMPVFRKYGLEGATLSVITDEIGLKRSSLYHHFPGGKEEMAAACLEQVEEGFRQRVLSVLRSDRSPEARIRQVTKELRAYYEDGRLGCLIGAFALETPRTHFAPALQRMLGDWIAGTAKLFMDQGIPRKRARDAAEEFVCAIQGALILSSTLDSKRPFLRAVKTLERFL